MTGAGGGGIGRFSRGKKPSNDGTAAATGGAQSGAPQKAITAPGLGQSKGGGPSVTDHGFSFGERPHTAESMGFGNFGVGAFIGGGDVLDLGGVAGCGASFIGGTNVGGLGGSSVMDGNSVAVEDQRELAPQPIPSPPRPASTLAIRRGGDDAVSVMGEHPADIMHAEAEGNASRNDLPEAPLEDDSATIEEHNGEEAPTNLDAVTESVPAIDESGVTKMPEGNLPGVDHSNATVEATGNDAGKAPTMESSPVATTEEDSISPVEGIPANRDVRAFSVEEGGTGLEVGVASVSDVHVPTRNEVIHAPDHPGEEAKSDAHPNTAEISANAQEGRPQVQNGAAGIQFVAMLRRKRKEREQLQAQAKKSGTPAFPGEVNRELPGYTTPPAGNPKDQIATVQAVRQTNGTATQLPISTAASGAQHRGAFASRGATFNKDNGNLQGPPKQQSPPFVKELSAPKASAQILQPFKRHAPAPSAPFATQRPNGRNPPMAKGLKSIRSLSAAKQQKGFVSAASQATTARKFAMPPRNRDTSPVTKSTPVSKPRPAASAQPVAPSAVITPDSHTQQGAVHRREDTRASVDTHNRAVASAPATKLLMRMENTRGGHKKPSTAIQSSSSFDTPSTDTDMTSFEGEDERGSNQQNASNHNRGGNGIRTLSTHRVPLRRDADPVPDPAPFEDLVSAFRNDIRDATDLLNAGDVELLDLNVELSRVWSIALSCRSDLNDLLDEIDEVQIVATEALEATEPELLQEDSAMRSGNEEGREVDGEKICTEDSI